MTRSVYDLAADVRRQMRFTPDADPVGHAALSELVARANFADAYVYRQRAEAAEAEVAAMRRALEQIERDFPGDNENWRWVTDLCRRALAAAGPAPDCEHDYVFKASEVYECDKCGEFSSDGVHPRVSAGPAPEEGFPTGFVWDEDEGRPVYKGAPEEGTA